MTRKEKATREAKMICARWVNLLGYGFHPDTRGADYSPALSAHLVEVYEFDMERLFSLPVKDPYEFAVNAMKAAFPCAS